MAEEQPGQEPDAEPTPLAGPADPETERRLRAVLARQADRLAPTDRYAAIQAAARGSEPEGRHRWRWVAVVAAALVLVVGVVNLPRILPHGGATTTAGAGAEAASSPRSDELPAPAATGDDQGSADSGGSASSGTQLTVYYLAPSLQRAETGSTPSPVRLYRENHALPATTSKLAAVAEAITAMATVPPDDADYETAWTTLGSTRVELVDGGLRVDLSADGFPAALPNSFTATEAIQQLVWTATTAYGADVPVTVLVDGSTNVSWGRELFGRPISRDAGVRSPVWINTPATGAQTAAGTVRVTGVASSPNGVVGYQVRDATNGDVAADGTVAVIGSTEYPAFEFTVSLTPGRYTVQVYAPDLTGANPLGEGDSKTWTVL